MRSSREPAQQLPALFDLQVERDAPFVSVVGPPVDRAIGICLIFEEGRKLARRRTTGRLHLDYIGAQVAENLAAQQASFGAEVEHSIRTQHRSAGRLAATLLPIRHGLFSDARDENIR